MKNNLGMDLVKQVTYIPVDMSQNDTKPRICLTSSYNGGFRHHEFERKPGNSETSAPIVPYEELPNPQNVGGYTWDCSFLMGSSPHHDEFFFVAKENVVRVGKGGGPRTNYLAAFSIFRPIRDSPRAGDRLVYDSVHDGEAVSPEYHLGQVQGESLAWGWNLMEGSQDREKGLVLTWNGIELLLFPTHGVYAVSKGKLVGDYDCCLSKRGAELGFEYVVDPITRFVVETKKGTTLSVQSKEGKMTPIKKFLPRWPHHLEEMVV